MTTNTVDPVLIYDGILMNIKENDNIGSSYFSNYNYNYTHNDYILQPFSRIFLNTKLGNLKFRLPTDNLETGMIIRIIDQKKSFLMYPLEINPQTLKLDGNVENKIYDIPGSIIDFIYINQDIGWISYVNEMAKMKHTSIQKFNIAQSTVGNRHGYFVCQTHIPNTVKLASATSLEKLPVVGCVLRDDETTVLVKTQNIDIIEVQLDSISIGPQPKQFIYLSEIDEGCGTNIEPQFGIIHCLGQITEVLSPVRVKINYFPRPEYVQAECELITHFGTKELVEADAGDGYQMILDTSGHIWSYGVNSHGQLGVGDTIDRDNPVILDQPCPVWSFSCGTSHSLLIDKNYDLWVSGNNSHGQLGTGNYDNVLYPTKLITKDLL